MPGQRSVLVVDPDPSDLSNTALVLQSAGYRVAVATAFDEAKVLLASESPDLLITGLRLGPYNGLHLVLRSRSDHPAMAAIVTSRYPDPVLEAEAQRQRAAFLLKPVTDTELLEAISASLGERAANPIPELAFGTDAPAWQG
jgi:DNA-binding NtrC family response regulator